MSVEIELLHKDSEFEIYAIVKSGECLATKFIETKCIRREEKKVIALLERAAKHGPPRNNEKCKHWADGIWEFKSHQVRILWFYDEGRKIILTHGFKKKDTRSKVFIAELKRAKSLRDEYFKTKR